MVYMILIAVVLVLILFLILHRKLAWLEVEFKHRVNLAEYAIKATVHDVKNDVLKLLDGGRAERGSETPGSDAASITEIIRNDPRVVALRARVRERAVEVTGRQIALALDKWKQNWKCGWRVNEWDAKYYVGRKQDVLEAVALAGADKVKYIVEFGDCNHFTKRSSGIVDTMLADPADNFGLGGTFGIVDDYGDNKPHSFLLVMTWDGTYTDHKPNLKPVMIEPQNSREVEPSSDPNSIYYVADDGMVFFM